MDNQWQRDESETTRATYHKGRYEQRTGYVSQYEGTDRYNWQDIRFGHRLSGIVYGVYAAMVTCDASMDLSDEEFNARVAANLITELKQFEKELLLLQPTTTLLPGYHAGFVGGYEKARRQVLSVLEDA